ncbi:MAG: hypothetical protein BM556_07825 [Bacteriovorax sp. MedPE-SWde]|nr:MAG: hypothetical protein BM556_07825 [Bacteriovorax sp. MedPE-SWde]
MKRIEVLYWDEHYIAVTKPAGLLVHPFKERSKDRSHLMRSVKKQTDLYLYPVHRLDKPVSGVVLFGLSKEATRRIKEQWNTELTQKRYITLCRGEIDEEGKFDFDLKGDRGPQEALTLYKRIATNGEYSLVDVEIKTGRMHQIRRHFSRRMFNIIGDSKYGRSAINNIFKMKYKFYRLFLHSYEFKFFHPFDNKWVTIRSSIPDELNHIIDDLDLRNP